jgi:hypothetical protein
MQIRERNETGASSGASDQARPAVQKSAPRGTSHSGERAYVALWPAPDELLTAIAGRAIAAT